MSIEAAIINWYHKNKRDLPWRKTKSAYKIWISEVLLQQTKVDQALDYYTNFLKKFPDIISLAKASEEEVLKQWQGLGYYSRARNLHFSAKYIVSELNGNMPKTFTELKQLKGVGEYTAAAIASFAYNESVPVVDGNVFRVLSRLYKEPSSISSSSGKKLFFEIAQELIQNQVPDVFNQAIMEFGALQCTPKNPDCTNCVLNNKCLAFASNVVINYPVKNKSLKKRVRFLNYLHINQNNFVFLNKRTGNDIWKGLFEFPLIETNLKMNVNALAESKDWQELFGNSKIEIQSVGENIIHKLSHQDLHVCFYKIKLKDEKNTKMADYLMVDKKKLDNYAIPKVIENYLSENPNF